MLPAALERAKASPDQLYTHIVQAVRDGFVADVVSAAEHLVVIDKDALRAANILGVIYLQLRRLADARRVLERFVAEHGEAAVVLTNLAKVHHDLGDPQRAEALLWRGLQLDPNEAASFSWYVALERERGGDAGEALALRRLAAVGVSWRARLWIARAALERGDLAAAIGAYEEALTSAPRPAPADLLMQMSGDLGKAGHLRELLLLTSNLFDPARHELAVGNNLLKANLDLGRIAEARRILELLRAQNRMDWKQHLQFWDTQIAKAKIAAGDAAAPSPIQLTAIEGPLWMLDPPFAALVPAKADLARRIAFLGSVVQLPDAPDQPRLQLSDGPGRMSRALPLFFAEKLHLTSDARATALVATMRDAFALLGAPYDTGALTALVHDWKPAIQVLFALDLDTRTNPWTLTWRALRGPDGALIASEQGEIDPANSEQGVARAWSAIVGVLEKEVHLRQIGPPAWYSPGDDADFLLRLEQQLAVRIAGSGLSGEHEIVEGALHRCVARPQDAVARMLYASTLRLMNKLRPGVAAAQRARAELLQKQHPIESEPRSAIAAVLAEVFAAPG